VKKSNGAAGERRPFEILSIYDGLSFKWVRKTWLNWLDVDSCDNVMNIRTPEEMRNALTEIPNKQLETVNYNVYVNART